MAITWTDRKRNEPIHLSLSAGTLTLSFGGASNFSFDGEGRLVGAWFDGLTYRRALDNRVQLKWSDPGQTGQRQRRMLDTPERKVVLARAYAAAAHVSRGLSGGSINSGETPAAVIDGVLDWLERIDGWAWARLEGEAERFAKIYKPISILPPDQYLGLVLQATEGCSYNECTFCTFYRDRPFRIKRETEFRQHATNVTDFFGRGRLVRKRLFLADANAVIIPQHRLDPLLAVANQAFPILPLNASLEKQRSWKSDHPWYLDGIYAFISAPDALHKTVDDFAAMREQNVRRLYVGLESGHDPLRAFLRKEGSGQDVVQAVEAMKAGGVSVGLIFMVGVGGEHYRQVHFEDTVELLKRLPLGEDDLIYLSPFVASEESPYVQDLNAANIEPLCETAITEEEARFKAALLSWAKARGVRLSRYDIREFLY